MKLFDYSVVWRPAATWYKGNRVADQRTEKGNKQIEGKWIVRCRRKFGSLSPARVFSGRVRWGYQDLCWSFTTVSFGTVSKALSVTMVRRLSRCWKERSVCVCGGGGGSMAYIVGQVVGSGPFPPFLVARLCNTCRRQLWNSAKKGKSSEVYRSLNSVVNLICRCRELWWACALLNISYLATFTNKFLIDDVHIFMKIVWLDRYQNHIIYFLNLNSWTPILCAFSSLSLLLVWKYNHIFCTHYSILMNFYFFL